MKSVYAYIRVSTQRQGTQGSSLQEQRSAIDAYAKRNDLSIVEWFEERETAAIRGRPSFSRMMKALSKGKAGGVVIHKIDRSARNLWDWAAVGDLVERGIEVHFAHESLDLRTRGGRLAADIQAVVAADYVRNLRDETRKGMYGRLKQGIYPLRAPIGYLDAGRAKDKIVDPLQGPLVRTAFELYATGEYTLHTLRDEMFKRGLRGRAGNAVSINGLATMLNNPFYIGLMHLRRTGETFQGNYAPLVSKALYGGVQQVLRGHRPVSSKWKHKYLFSGLIRCASCERKLPAELQKKRYVYYRCHNVQCGTVCLSERVIDEKLKALFETLQLNKKEVGDLRDMAEKLTASSAEERRLREGSLKLAISKCNDRLSRLTDMLIDGTLDQPLFNAKKEALLMERLSLEEQLDQLAKAPMSGEKVMGSLELGISAYVRYKSGFAHEKRELVSRICSNLFGQGNEPAIALYSPYHEWQKQAETHRCDLRRDSSRTRVKKLFEILVAAAEQNSIEPFAAKSPMSPKSLDGINDT